MILQIYHCNLVIIKDKSGTESSKGKSKQTTSIKPFISELGKMDTVIFPSTKHFITVHHKVISGIPVTEIQDESDMGRLIEEFLNIDLLAESFIHIDWEAIALKLNIPLERIMAVRNEAYKRGLLRNLTINYDLQKWLHHSKDKGVMVIMASVEKFDYNNSSLFEQFVKEIKTLRDNMVNIQHGDFLNTAIVVPNVHLAEEEDIGFDHENNLEILHNCCKCLESSGFEVYLNSYGRSKMLMLGIVGHQVGGFVRRAIRQTNELLDCSLPD